MTGPSDAPYVIAIVAFVLLTLWLSLVFWANRHPQPRIPGVPDTETGDETRAVETRPPVEVPAQSSRDAVPAAGAAEPGREPAPEPSVPGQARSAEEQRLTGSGQG